MEGQDERTFLCGYQRTRGYGSLSNLHISAKTYRTVIQHQIKPNDTLQGLVLKYNTSMSEIKRLNRLWSNESFYLKEYVEIPIYDEMFERGRAMDRPMNVKNDRCCEESKKSQDIDEESLQDIFQRIDKNIRKTTNSVNKLTENSTADFLAEGFKMEVTRNKPECRIKDRRPFNHSSGFQNEAFQN
ncbi:LysM domain-containing protein [Loa loa]|uniref:LysM domain-containing protein n=1 Tax=Loa loa TaxID=7209 RepID=A0A1I7VZN8_LOALO|nr:LysM domain-containing protein [Loa loa]EFO28271.2 LysM domain-containing protein [Loa loa]